MTDEPDNVVLVHLRALRDGQTRIAERLDVLTTRMQTVEGSLAFLVTHITLIQARLDRIESRLDRVEAVS